MRDSPSRLRASVTAAGGELAADSRWGDRALRRETSLAI